MLIFYKAGLAYLAVPKTGTTSIEIALEPFASAILRDPPGLKHCNARKFNRKFRGLFEQNAKPLETLAVMREPVEWLGSWYRYRQRDFLDGKPRSTKGISFVEFVSAYFDPRPPEFAQVGAQSKFLTDGQGRCLVDHLFAYDQLEALRMFLKERLGREIILEHHNPSPRPKGFTLDLPDAIYDALKSSLRVDFDLYASLKD